MIQSKDARVYEIDYLNYTAEDWYQRAKEFERQGRWPNLSATCRKCLLPIPTVDEEGSKLLSDGCACGPTTTHKELDAAHGLTGYVGSPEKEIGYIEEWADVG